MHYWFSTGTALFYWLDNVEFENKNMMQGVVRNIIHAEAEVRVSFKANICFVNVFGQDYSKKIINVVTEMID